VSWRYGILPSFYCRLSFWFFFPPDPSSSPRVWQYAVLSLSPACWRSFVDLYLVFMNTAYADIGCLSMGQVSIGFLVASIWNCL
jgi:hypothetical protein